MNILSKKKSGISLIVLIITIIVAAILIGAVILETRDSKVESRAEEVKFKQSISTFIDELDMYLNQKKLDASNNNENFSVESYSETNTETIGNEVITSIKGTEYDGKLVIKNGRLALKDGADFTDKEKQWFEEVK